MALGLDEATIERLLDRRLTRGDVASQGTDAELHEYLMRARGRLAATLEAMVEAGFLRPGALVLEVGAEPWLVTQLLLEHGAEVVTCGKRPGIWREDDSVPSPEPVELRWGGREANLDHHLFDAERDQWPFPDGSFESVVCAEVIEHLVFNPGHMLYEANRVLGHGGTLVLTTPNAVALRKTALHLRGRNVHWAYSGYGPQGRHNREYTAGELRELLAAANFESEVRARNVEGYEADEPLGRALRPLAELPLGVFADRGDHLFAVATKAGPPRMPTPAWLYRSWSRDRLRREGAVLADEPTADRAESPTPTRS